MASRLRFEIQPSPGSNDSEVRIIVDDRDWLGEGYLGLDPPELVDQFEAVTDERTLIVGRCRCGVVGCDDRVVKFRRDGDTVFWNELAFVAEEYDGIIHALASDHSWEDVGRRAERLVGDVFRGAVLENALRFDWASTRIKPNLVHLSFSGSGEQRLLEFSWDGASEESALRRARQFYRERIEVSG